MDVEDDRSKQSRSRFLFPGERMRVCPCDSSITRAKVMRDLFRGVVMRRVRRMYDAGELRCVGRAAKLAAARELPAPSESGPSDAHLRCTRPVSSLRAEAVLVSRFLLHVLPSGFHKIRHFGLYAPTHAKLGLQQARRHLDGASAETSAPTTTAVAEAGTDQSQVRENPEIPVCPRCGGSRRRHAIPRARAPPLRRSW